MRRRQGFTLAATKRALKITDPFRALHDRLVQWDTVHFGELTELEDGCQVLASVTGRAERSRPCTGRAERRLRTLRPLRALLARSPVSARGTGHAGCPRR
ncbi:hypothetical protein ACFQ7F_18830 [Streptomyces sp. NPDC056486]|uniref:hypothetical protein n=1 Tax=Streptomyces sp. NPDC056486 TaxID=3345835 RepID=UPI0036756568